MLVRERIREILDPGTELWELCTNAGLGLEYGDVSLHRLVLLYLAQIVLPRYRWRTEEKKADNFLIICFV